VVGLGDQLSGLITASAVALLSGRTLKLDVSPGFQAAWQPAGERSWRDATAPPNASYEPSVCGSSLACPALLRLSRSALDTVSFDGNRALLCQWLAVNHSDTEVHRQDVAWLRERALSVFGSLRQRASPFQIAGCLLRAAVVPSTSTMALVASDYPGLLAARTLAYPAAATIGVHYRCGDQSFRGEACEQWSSQSPSDLLRCASKAKARASSGGGSDGGSSGSGANDSAPAHLTASFLALSDSEPVRDMMRQTMLKNDPTWRDAAAPQSQVARTPPAVSRRFLLIPLRYWLFTPEVR
jgi:hypothetical protein